MKKSIRIQIPEPCHEDWNQMTPTEKGKHCAVCTKEVIDFSTKADEDLVKILSKSKNVCGRFKKTQLNREVKFERKSGLNLAPYAASLLLPLSLLSTNGASSNNSDTSNKTFTSLGIGRYSSPDRAIVHTSGKVVDSSGNLLAGVLILSNESKKSVSSDSDGNYMITTMDHEVLSFQKEGFQVQEIVLGSSSSEKNISLVSEMCETLIMGGISELNINKEQTIDNIDSTEEVSEEKVLQEKVSEVITIKGTVSDEKGEPLPGANIIINGTQIGTTSDFDGNYSIEANANQVLSFSYLGFETQQITLSNISNYVNVILEPGAVLGEFVTTGIVIIGDYEPYIPPPNAAEMEAEGKQRKVAFKNERAFKQLQLARKKAARKLKRSQRK